MPQATTISESVATSKRLLCGQKPISKAGSRSGLQQQSRGARAQSERAIRLQTNNLTSLPMTRRLVVAHAPVKLEPPAYWNPCTFEMCAASRRLAQNRSPATLHHRTNIQAHAALGCGPWSTPISHPTSDRHRPRWAPPLRLHAAPWGPREVSPWVRPIVLRSPHAPGADA